MSLMVWFADFLFKKYTKYVYIGAAALNIISFIIYKTAELPWFIKDYILGVFTSGTLGIAGFYIVMFAGCLSNGTILIKKLMVIRGELSIASCILMLSHLLIYGPEYILNAIKHGTSMSWNLLVSIIIGCVLLIQMAYLGITSIKAVRRKMDGRKWKKLQKTAYLFYFLMYLHGVLMQSTKVPKGDLNALVTIIAYSIVFFAYVVLKLRKNYVVSGKIKTDIEPKKFDYIVTSVLSIIAVIMVASIIVPQCKTYASFDNNVSASSLENKDEKKVAKENADNKDKNNLDNNYDQKSESADKNNKVGNEDEAKKDEVKEDDMKTSNEASVSGEQMQSGQSSAGISNNANNLNSNEENSVSNSAGTRNPTAAPQVTRKYKGDGTYTGSAMVEDYAYNITVTITVSNDTITSAVADISAASDLDYDYAEMAAGGLSPDGYSAVSGATYSSSAFMAAYNSAVSSALN